MSNVRLGLAAILWLVIDSLEHELNGMLHANRPSRAEEWREPELPPDEDRRWEDTRPKGPQSRHARE